MHFFDIKTLIETIGILGIFLFIFAESGLFFGFFLPGDSLLFTAGILAGAGYFNIYILFIGAFLCAVSGDYVGYYFGYYIGPKIFSKPNSFFFNKKNIQKTSEFYEKYGKKAVSLARFIPIVRTFTPILAGVGKMKFKDFFFYNIVGGFLWTLLMVFTGYFLSSRIKNIDHFILPIVFFIILFSFVPVFLAFFKKNNV
ncbi:DedA family protein [Candidatus Nomurabacteria bacterium]|nr:DedA family protein [Candidatus Nomurabacteria bacterium]